MNFVISNEGRAELLKKGLTMRQVHVCEGLMNYADAKDVAKIVGVSEKTVKYHLTIAMRSLGLRREGRRHYLLVFLLPLMIKNLDPTQLLAGSNNAIRGG